MTIHEIIRAEIMQRLEGYGFFDGDVDVEV